MRSQERPAIDSLTAKGALTPICPSFDDDSTALWKISTSSSAILKFNASSTKAVLDGNFEIFSAGKLLVDSGGFQTDGTLHWTGGTIDVASSAIADFGEFPETDPR